MTSKIGLVALVAAAAMAAQAQRAPTVSYTVSGSSGAYTLDFTVQNNFLSGEGDIYFFGVLLDTGRNIVGSPASWDPNAWTTWDNTPYGGSSTIYNNNWIDFASDSTDISPGASLSGFQAMYTGATAPTQVAFFAYAYQGTYGGNDYFNNPDNPGFEGMAAPVPEPATFALLGLGSLALIRRKR